MTDREYNIGSISIVNSILLQTHTHTSHTNIIRLQTDISGTKGGPALHTILPVHLWIVAIRTLHFHEILNCEFKSRDMTLCRISKTGLAHRHTQTLMSPIINPMNEDCVAY